MLRILHLEDCRHDALFVRNALLSSGIEAQITIASSREKFMAAIENNSFDVILADSGLSAFDGLEALEILRNTWPDIPFICVSGNNHDRHIRAFLDAGATAYVSKDNLSELGPILLREQEKLSQRPAGNATF